MKCKVIVWSCVVAALLMCRAAAAEGFEIQEDWQVELFQCGSLTGEHTLPRQVEWLDDGETAIREEVEQAILAGLTERAETITLTNKSMSVTQESLNQYIELVRTAFETVVNDHPELFYVTGACSMRGSGSAAGLMVVLTPGYRPCTDEMVAALDRAVERVLAQVDNSMEPVEQLLAIHDELMTSCAYNWEVATTGSTANPYVYSAYGALVDGDAVCQGYALAYKLLLNEIGINCVTVSSSAMHHMWNLVELEGQWYHVDVTWDDPTPNVEGGGRHANFLRSDAGIQETGHHDWEETEIVCTEDYREDWWLNDVWFPIYAWQGSYYYVKMGFDVYEYRLYRTSTLESAGEPVMQSQLANGYSSQNGILWLEGQLYYTKASGSGFYVLSRCRLSDGATVRFGSIPFTAAASDDEYYEKEYDGIGLRYDAEKDRICTSSNTRPAQEMPEFEPQRYPVEWDQYSGNETRLLGSEWSGDGVLQVGIYCAEEGIVPGNLLAAFYQEGRMVQVRMVELDGLQTGLNVVKLEAVGGSGTLFLLTEGELLPCGPASQIPAETSD